MEKIIVNKKYDNKKLNKIILDKIPEINYNTFCKLLRKKDIKVNQKRTNKDIMVFESDIIEIYLPNMKKESKENEIQDIDIIYEDDNILAINKKANIEVTGENSLTEKIQKIYKEKQIKPMPCHRIDRNTTGIVLFAKDEETLQILLNKFRNHEIEKHYLALVYGIPKEKQKRLEDYLFKDKKKSQVYISKEYKKGYQKIITKYKVIEQRKDNTSLLDVEIETGKTHQIRAHLASIGHQIIGDGKYGRNEINKKFNKKYQCLTSYKIKFNFTTESGKLEYLKGKTIEIKKLNNKLSSFQ